MKLSSFVRLMPCTHKLRYKGRNWSADGLPSLGNPLGLSMQPSQAPNSPQDRGYRGPSAGPGGSASNNPLAQISAAQLLPNYCQSLYGTNPGAMLGSGQAAGMALGSHSHTSLSAGLNASSSPLAMGAARYLAGLGMGSTVSCLLFWTITRHDMTHHDVIQCNMP